MFLRRIFKGMPDLGPWVSLVELLAALLTVAATLIALDIVPSPFRGAPTGTITGTVTDARTGISLPEATVQITDSTSRVIAAESIPDAKGAWTEAVKPGSYAVKAICDGYKPLSKTVIVAQNKTRIVRLAILPQPQETAEASASSAVPRTIERGVAAPAPASQPAVGAGAQTATAESAPGVDTQQVEKLMADARSLNNADKQAEALRKLQQASDLDPTDGRIYALAIKIDVGKSNFVDAKDWYKDGVKYAKKYKSELEQAGELLE